MAEPGAPVAPPNNAAQPEANVVVDMEAADAAMAAALAEAEEEDDEDEEEEVAEIRIGKRFHLSFPGLLVGHVLLHWLDRVKTEVQVGDHCF